MSDLAPPGAVKWIARTLEEKGFETWAVGGAVRDGLLGIDSSDWDLTTRATPRQMQQAFRRTVPIGVDHGTVGVLDRTGTLYEVTTFRRDVETTGRHAVVAFADTVEEDLARRDFTINAIAWHPLRDELFDPFGGADDLEAGVLRTVGTPGDRFSEDFLRVLRALRFAGRFSLAIEGASWRALCAAVPGMERLSPERIREELEKVLQDPVPSRALSLYAASGALGLLYPELDHLVGVPHETGMGDRWSHLLHLVDLLPPLPWEARLAALLHRSGDGSVAEGDAFEETVLATVAIMTRLRFSNARIRSVGAWAGGVRTVPPPGSDAVACRRWLARMGREGASGAIRIGARLLRLNRALEGAVEGEGFHEEARWIRALRRELRSGVPLTEGELALGGRDLIRMGFRPGPRFGEVFEALLAWVHEDPSRNEGLQLAERARELLGDGDDGEEA